MENEEEILFTPSKILTKDDASLIDLSDNRSHLEINGVVHSYIVKQLTNHLDLFLTLRFSTPKHSIPQKGAQTCIKIVKVGDRKHHNVILIPNSDHDGEDRK
jgi:hypothetical protein